MVKLKVCEGDGGCEIVLMLTVITVIAFTAVIDAVIITDDVAHPHRRG